MLLTNVCALDESGGGEVGKRGQVEAFGKTKRYQKYADVAATQANVSRKI